MEKKIIIIHRSAIVRIGLKAIIEKITDMNIELMENATSQFNKHSSKSIVFIEDALFVEIQKKQSQIHQNTTIITIGNSILPTDISRFKNNCAMYDTEHEIHELLKPYLTSNNEKISINKSENITPRETEVLKQIALGFSNKEIANKLFISLHTVISHRKNITSKLGIKSISGLTVYAFMNKIIDTNSQ